MALFGNIFGTLGNFISRIDQRYSSSLNSRQLQALRMVHLGSMPVYPDPSLDTFIKAYTNNASIFPIVNLAARKFSFVPRYVMKEEDEEGASTYKTLMRQGKWSRGINVRNRAYKVIATGPGIKGEKGLSELLKRPNPNQGQDAFFFAVYVSYCICGESFTWLNRGEFDENVSDDIADKLPVLEMYYMPPQLVEVIPDEQDVWGVSGYVFQINGARVTVRKNDVIHWKRFTPEFDATTRIHLRGHPPLKSGLKALTQDEDSTDAAVAMYQNGGARGALFEKSLKNISVTQKQQIEDITAKRINNKDLKSAVANLQGDWGYLDIGKDSVDMELLEGNKLAFAKLCHVFGVPPGLFLIDQTYENQRSNRKRMLSELVMPDCESFNDEMNRMLLPAFGLKGMRVMPDYSELPEIQEEQKEQVESLKQMPITINEFREAIGYDKVSDKEADMILIDSGKAPISDLGMTEVDDVLNSGLNGQSNRTNSNGKVPGNGKRTQLQN